MFFEEKITFPTFSSPSDAKFELLSDFAAYLELRDFFREISDFRFFRPKGTTHDLKNLRCRIGRKCADLNLPKEIAERFYIFYLGYCFSLVCSQQFLHL